VPEAAGEASLGQAHFETGFNGGGAIGDNGETLVRREAPAQKEVAQGAIALLVLSSSQHSADDLLRAGGVSVGSEEEGVGVAAPVAGQRSPEVTVEAVHLDLLGAAG
jgi:hypothetical protein